MNGDNESRTPSKPDKRKEEKAKHLFLEPANKPGFSWQNDGVIIYKPCNSAYILETG